MRTLIALAAIATTVLVAAPSAAAKQLVLTVCGADECTSAADLPELRALVSLAPGEERPASEAAFYSGTIRAIGSAGAVRIFRYVPSEGAMRIDDATPFWIAVPARVRRMLDRTTRGLEPYPAAPSSGGDAFTGWPALAAAVAALALVGIALRRLRRRRLAAVGLAALAVLALPGAVLAKNYGRPELCGPARCVRADFWLRSLPAGEARVVPAPAQYYALGPGSDGWYVPSARVLAPRAGAVLTRVTSEAAAAFERLAVGLEPFPAPRITAAFVGGRRVTGDASTYARLFELEGGGSAVNVGADWVPIELRSERDTPWTNGATYLAYSASRNLLQRGTELIRVPAGIARCLDRARALSRRP